MECAVIETETQLRTGFVILQSPLYIKNVHE